MLTNVPHIISKNHYKRKRDATRIKSFMAAAYVCMHSVHTTEILILFLRYCDIFSMHRPNHSMFPNVLIISAGAFTDFGNDATRNVIII
jgi:hypothetical protein